MEQNKEQRRKEATRRFFDRLAKAYDEVGRKDAAKGTREHVAKLRDRNV